MDSRTLPELDTLFAESSTHYHHRNYFFPKLSFFKFMMIIFWEMRWSTGRGRAEALLSYDRDSPRCPSHLTPHTLHPLMTARPRVRCEPLEVAPGPAPSCHPQVLSITLQMALSLLTPTSLTAREAGAGLRTGSGPGPRQS